MLHTQYWIDDNILECNSFASNCAFLGNWLSNQAANNCQHLYSSRWISHTTPLSAQEHGFMSACIGFGCSLTTIVSSYMHIAHIALLCWALRRTLYYISVSLVLVVGLCLNHHLLQMESSMIRIVRCINLWTYWYVIKR